jgi:hypothetical protein
LFTENQIQAQLQSQLAAIKQANSSISAAASDAKKVFTQIPLTFAQCSAKIITDVFKAFTSFLASSSSSSSSSQSENCLKDATAQLTNLSNQVSTAVQSAVQQAQTQANATKSDGSSPQSAADEYQKVNEETSACVQDAVNSSKAASDSSGTASDPSDTASDSSDTSAGSSDTAGSA